MDARKEILIEQRKLLTIRMQDLQKTTGLLDFKIEFYESAVSKQNVK